MPRTVKAQLTHGQKVPQSTYRGRVDIGRSVSALTAGGYTITLYVLVDIVKRGRGAPPPPPHPHTRLGNFYIILEFTPESGNCHSVYHVASTNKNMQTNKTEAKFLVPDRGIHV